MTVAGLCDEYLAKANAGQLVTRRGGIKPSTVYTDAGRIERHIKPLLGSRAVRDLSESDITQFRDDVIGGKTAANVKTKKRGRPIVKGGKGTAARTLGLLGAILSYGIARGIRTDNPAQRVVRPAGERRSHRLSMEQCRRNPGMAYRQGGSGVPGRVGCISTFWPVPWLPGIYRCRWCPAIPGRLAYREVDEEHADRDHPRPDRRPVQQSGADRLL